MLYMFPVSGMESVLIGSEVQLKSHWVAAKYMFHDYIQRAVMVCWLLMIIEFITRWYCSFPPSLETIFRKKTLRLAVAQEPLGFVSGVHAVFLSNRDLLSTHWSVNHGNNNKLYVSEVS